MKIKNINLIIFVNVLQKYMDYKLPQKISYAIARNFTTLSEEYKFYSTQYEKLIKEFADKIEKDENDEFKFDERGIPIIEDPTDAASFAESINDLLNIEVDVDSFYINAEEFDYDDSEKYDALSPSDIHNLKSLLCKSETE